MSDSDRPPITGEALNAVSSEISRLMAQLFGRGPLQAKAFLNDELLVCMLKGGLTKVEETLFATGDEALVRQVRQRFQDKLAPVFIQAVEKLTGRRVCTYQSQILFNPDYVVEMFILDDA